MGMAASQARYLGLTARKTNCEWEGQQINQARTALANQSANLFNQLLNLKVPDCPDKTDFTTVQYSYSDGFNNSVLDNWRQLSDSTTDYNYIVDHYYYADIYTGAKKLMSDPQVTFKNSPSELPMNPKPSHMVTALGSSYFYNGNEYQDLTQYKYDNELQYAIMENRELRNAILDLVQQGLVDDPDLPGADNPNFNFTPEVTNAILNQLRGYHDGNSWHFALVEELKASADFVPTLKPGYVDLSDLGITKAAALDHDNNPVDPAILARVKDAFGLADEAAALDWLQNGDFADGVSYYTDAGVKSNIDEAFTTPPPFNDMTTTFDPEYVGNQRVTELGALSLQDRTALAQIAKDCPDSSILNYLKVNTDGSIDYQGSGIYKFTWNGADKYVTYDDLVDSMQTPLYDEKPIEAQYKLPTYEANYIKQEVKETNYALLESDGNGRFKTVKFDDDSTVYTLNCEQITDEATYNDAMNSYYHDVAEYEKKIADINAQTEVIQQQDRTLELRLKQLDTEQNALQTEMEAVKKVISKNVEMTFKTFSGS